MQGPVNIGKLFVRGKDQETKKDKTSSIKEAKVVQEKKYLE